MKRKGSSIIFVNHKQEILLFLRDDKLGLPYANMWDVLGGHVESDETPRKCIIREMKEEIGLELADFQLLCEKEFDDRIEFTYWKFWDVEITDITLMEGQRLKWFTKNEIAKTTLAYGFNEIIEVFFTEIYFPLFRDNK